jgi:hypothetical protein
MSVTSVHPEHENDAAWNELRPVLHDEVNRLPEKYRLPVILSYLEGKSNEEVARVLNWPVGTVKGRLSRARDLLRSRLTRRGLVLSAAFLCTALSRGELFAESVPESLIDRTLSSAMRVRHNLAAAELDPETRSSGQADQPNPPNRLSRSRFTAKPAITSGRLGFALVVLAAALSVGFAIASFVLSDPSTMLALRNMIRSLSRGQWSHFC